MYNITKILNISKLGKSKNKIFIEREIFTITAELLKFFQHD